MVFASVGMLGCHGCLIDGVIATDLPVGALIIGGSGNTVRNFDFKRVNTAVKAVGSSSLFLENGLHEEPIKKANGPTLIATLVKQYLYGGSNNANV